MDYEAEFTTLKNKIQVRKAENQHWAGKVFDLSPYPVTKDVRSGRRNSERQVFSSRTIYQDGLDDEDDEFIKRWKRVLE